MLILPLHRKPSREDFPTLTLLLVLANALVFALLQSGDRAVEDQAAERYVDSGVLEQEWRWFQDWAETRRSRDVRAAELDDMLPEPGESARADRIRFMTIEGEPDFLRAVRNEWFVAADSKAYQQWQAARARLEADRDQSFTRRHMLAYDDFESASLITHMFMHGGLMHLIGNMLFLVLLGILLEPALGALRLGLAYLVGGLGAAALSLTIHWNEGSGMVGASGAIAGMMGLLAVVYGMRRIRFFYWAFVYFDYVRAPALVLLPLWFGWEVFAYLADEGGNIAYDAHIGGIVSGALIGLVLVRTGQVRDEWLEEAEIDDAFDRDRGAVRAAQAALDDLDAVEAKRQLRPLLARHGRDTELLRLYFAACQLRGDDPDLHDAARRILRLRGESHEQRRLVVDVFRRYFEASGGRLKIRADEAVELANRLLDWDRVDEARALLDRMIRMNRPLPGRGTLCGRMAEKLEACGVKPELAERYRRLAEAREASAGRR